MTKELEKFNEIVAIVPGYNREGENICRITFKDRTSQIVKMKVSTFLEQYLVHLNMDLASRRVWANKLLNKRHLNPIIINPNTSLLPIKTREAIGAKDGCYGYVKYEAIKSFNQDRVLLEGDIPIPYLSSTKTLQNKFRDADFLKSTYEKQVKAQYEACMAEDRNFTRPKDETQESFIF